MGQLILWRHLESFRVVLDNVVINSVSLFDNGQYIVVATAQTDLTFYDLDLKVIFSVTLHAQLVNRVIST